MKKKKLDFPSYIIGFIVGNIFSAVLILWSIYFLGVII